MNKQTTKRAVAVAVVGAVMLGSVAPFGGCSDLVEHDYLETSGSVVWGD